MWCAETEDVIDDPPVFLFVYHNWLVIDIISLHLCLSQALNNQTGILSIYSNIHHHIQSTTHTKTRTPCWQDDKRHLR